MEEILIAPCGMNCAICSGYLAGQYDIRARGIRMPYCAGCRPRNKQCAYLKKWCRLLMTGQVKYCYECPDFPCHRIQTIDRRYGTRYRMSMIENLRFIQANGAGPFLLKEAEKWRCPECGGVINCHNGICYSCGLEKLRVKKNKIRWE